MKRVPLYFTLYVIKLRSIRQGVGILPCSSLAVLLRLSIILQDRKKRTEKRQRRQRNKTPVMNSIFYPISYIKKSILLNFLIYLGSADHSEVVEMVSMVAQEGHDPIL